MSRIRATSSAALCGVSVSSSSEVAAEDKPRLIQTQAYALSRFKLADPLGQSRLRKGWRLHTSPMTDSALILCAMQCLHA